MYTYVLDLRFLLAAYCNIGTARVGHLHNPYNIRLDVLTKGPSSSRCRFSNELTENFRIPQPFQWY